ncbi:uncharacterized protein LOC111710193 [Eurytemora carolleeae]|uniref:uncharacterized protein LOC111710193 n=1 Tax=Eurytemora carolleeae TaxID=1294199 RepID=UPI000C7778AC|nr:uncharacterized protein LOC111710193 [Eurytemora carolleeae]|eukprot:XP_023340024.1 uncharacterized protein LOC111710193 [Eurytemora affinis]
MNSGHRNSLHHLYYSSHADPTDTLIRANTLKSKSSYQLNQYPLSKQYGSRWTIAQPSTREQLEARQEKIHNTYYNNMMCYINYRQNDTDSATSKKSRRALGKSVESLALRKSTVEGQVLPLKSKKESQEEDCAACSQCDGCCTCSSGTKVCWSLILCLVSLSIGFLGGVVVGAIVQRDGHLSQIGFGIPGEYYNYLQKGREEPVEDGGGRCVVRMQQTNLTTTNCSVCSNSRVLNVTGAGYADCNGLYTISNQTSIWDSKQVVYERINGGWGKEKRYIYWNAHYYGENFYGWSIGDSKSLFESGPFHSQGRAGASNLPWRGSWRGNVTVYLSSCQLPIDKIRLGRQGENQYDRERERELNRLRNMERNSNIFND